MSRWKAAAIHLGLSALITLAVVALMLLVWYPPPYFVAMGGNMLVLLIIGCDVVIGPLITLIVFRTGKQGLTTDLSIIACMQLAALAYGMHTMFIARPVFVVFVIDRFEVVAANQIADSELEKADRPEFRTLPLTGPRIIGARLPVDPQQQYDLAVSAVAGGADVKNLPRLYVPYESVRDDVRRKAKPLSELKARGYAGSGAAGQVDAGRLGYVPLNAREKSMSVLIDRDTGNVSDIIDVSPW